MLSTTRRHALFPLFLVVLMLAGGLPGLARAQYPAAVSQELSGDERKWLTKAYRATRPGEAGRDERHKLLRYAVQRRDMALFDTLTAGGTPPGTPGHDPDAGMTALMYAAEADDFDALRCLLPLKKQTGDYAFGCLYPNAPGYIDRCDRDGYTALMYAATSGNVEAANYLMNAGASLETRCYVARFTPLQLAQNGTTERHALVAAALEKKIGERAGQKAWWQILFFNEAVAGSIGYSIVTGVVIGLTVFLGYNLVPVSRRLDRWAKSVVDKDGSGGRPEDTA